MIEDNSSFVNSWQSMHANFKVLYLGILIILHLKYIALSQSITETKTSLSSIFKCLETCIAFNMTKMLYFRNNCDQVWKCLMIMDKISRAGDSKNSYLLSHGMH